MTALDQNFSDLANILMQRRQMQAQQVQQERANRLSDLQFKQLQREDDYQTGLRDAMSNPGGSGVTLSQLQPPQPQQNTLASLAPGNQLPFQQPQASFAPVEAKMSPSRAGAEYALGQGKIEDAVKLFSVDDHVAQLRAKGDLQGYYEAQRELEEGSKFFDVVNKFKANPKQLTALWPQIQRMFPQQSEGIMPDSIKFNSDYTVLPLVMDGKTIPGKGILRDGEGKTSIIDTTPKEQPETWGQPYQTKVGGKLVMLQKSSRGQIRPVVQDTSTTVKVSTGNQNTDFKNESSMRKEFLTLPEVKDYPTIESNSRRAVMALKSQGKSNVAVDQTIITVFNKMLDPTSVVRESEYARTPQDLSVLSRIKGKWDKIQRGGAGLDSNERAALARMVQNFNEIASQQYNDQVEYYSGLAKRYGYKPENIVRLGGRKSAATPTPSAPTVTKGGFKVTVVP